MFDFKKTSFEDIVSKILVEYKDETTEKVNEAIEEACEAYVMHYGKKPDSYQLTLLANLILKDDLKNPSPRKVKDEEFPFHSYTQRKRRNKQEFTVLDDTLEHINFKKKMNMSTASPKVEKGELI